MLHFEPRIYRVATTAPALLFNVRLTSVYSALQDIHVRVRNDIDMALTTGVSDLAHCQERRRHKVQKRRLDRSQHLIRELTSSNKSSPTTDYMRLDSRSALLHRTCSS